VQNLQYSPMQPFDHADVLPPGPQQDDANDTESRASAQPQSPQQSLQKASSHPPPPPQPQRHLCQTIMMLPGHILNFF